MAGVRLDFYDLDGDALPDLCMQCGAPAVTRRNKTFSWQPSWVIVLILFGLLPYLIVALLLTKRRTVSVPLCDAHKNHWLWRTTALLASFLVLCLIGAGALVLLASSDQGGDAANVGGWVCLATVVLLIAWLVAAAIIQQSAIRPTEITDEMIRLTHVSRDFADAYEDERERDYRPRMDDIARDQWDRPRRRRPPAGDEPPDPPPDDKYQRG